MDTAIIFSLTLAILFFGSITWLVIHSRREERRTDESNKPEAAAPEPSKEKHAA